MGLIPNDLKKQIPKLYETEMIDVHDKMAKVKLHSPNTHWEWYVVEYDGDDICFGLVKGHEVEFGYFSIKELEEIKNPSTVRRDESFEPVAVSKLLLQGMSERG